MEITVGKTGGFAGVHEKLGPLETGSLDAAAANRLESKVREIGFFDMPKEIPDSGGIRDAFHYQVSVADGDRSHSVSFGGRAAADHEHHVRGLGELIRLLEEAGFEFTEQPRERQGP